MLYDMNTLELLTWATVTAVTVAFMAAWQTHEQEFNHKLTRAAGIIAYLIQIPAGWLMSIATLIPAMFSSRVRWYRYRRSYMAYHAA